MEKRQTEEFNKVDVYPNKHKYVKFDTYNLVFKLEYINLTGAWRQHSGHK